jgi:tetratricopeptide (TPR) repeat protein
MTFAYTTRVIALYILAGMAQQAPAQTGGVTLIGEIVGSDEPDVRWQLELRPLGENRALPPDRVHVMAAGRFQFSGVTPGTYELILLNANQEPADREIVAVHAFTSTVQLRMKQPEQPARPGGAISVQRLSHKVPKQARKEHDKGRKERQGKNPAAAEAHYLNALAADPRYLDAANDLGVLYYVQSRYAESHRVLEQALTIDPHDATILANLSATLMALKRYPEAEDFAHRAVRMSPTLTRSRYLLGLSRLAQEKYGPETQALLEEAAQLIPHARLGLARMFTLQGDKESARVQLESYLAAKSQRPAGNRTQVESWLKSLR